MLPEDKDLSSKDELGESSPSLRDQLEGKGVAKLGDADQVIKPVDVPFITQTLKGTPGLILYVTDARDEHGIAWPLMVREDGQTLQAQVGKTRYAVEAHPERFKLTDESYIRLLEARRKMELVTPPAPARAMFGASTDHSSAQRAETQQQILDEIERYLTQSLGQNGGNLILGRRALAIEGKAQRVSKIASKLAASSLKLRRYHFPRHPDMRSVVLPGVGGRDVHDMLRNALVAASRSQLLQILRETDSTKFGPSTLAYDTNTAILYMLNQQAAQQTSYQQK